MQVCIIYEVLTHQFIVSIGVQFVEKMAILFKQLVLCDCICVVVCGVKHYTGLT